MTILPEFSGIRKLIDSAAHEVELPGDWRFSRGKKLPAGMKQGPRHVSDGR
jgi:hypothetical protein